MSKRYFWLRLKDDFFDSKRIKRLRKMSDTYVIIYLKLQLKAMKTEGVIQFSGLEDSAAEEFALDINEDPDDVATTLDYLLTQGLCESQDGISYFFPYALENTRSEGASAERNRHYRARKASLCDTDVTDARQKRDGDIEKDIDIDIDTDIDIDRPSQKQFSTGFSTYLSTMRDRDGIL